MNTSSVVDSAAGAEGLAQRDAKAIATLDIHELARLPQAEIDAAVAELHAIDERHAERLAEFEAARQDVDKGHRLLVDKARAKVDAEMAAKYKPTKISKNGPDTVLTFRSAKQALAYSREYDARLESVLAPLREDYGTALSSLSSLEEYRASYEEEEAVRGRIHDRLRAGRYTAEHRHRLRRRSDAHAGAPRRARAGAAIGHSDQTARRRRAFGDGRHGKRGRCRIF